MDFLSADTRVDQLYCQACEQRIKPIWRSMIDHIGRDPITKRLVATTIVEASCSVCHRLLARIICTSPRERWNKED